MSVMPIGSASHAMIYVTCCMSAPHIITNSVGLALIIYGAWKLGNENDENSKLFWVKVNLIGAGMVASTVIMALAAQAFFWGLPRR